jgi:RNA polymerase subunit RPABC4/transcription elongation factor Spt4
MSSVKCLQCGMVNFATDGLCKRCGADMAQASRQTFQTHAPASLSSVPPGPLPSSPNLAACVDCSRPVSLSARSCPHCGKPSGRTPAGAVVSELLGMVLLIAAGIVAYVGLNIIYDPTQKVGGDAFNYIIAASRGTGIIAVGVGLAVIGSALAIIGAIQRYR